MSFNRISLGTARKPPPAATNGVKRPRAALHEDEDDEDHEQGRAEKVSHFDRQAGGAIDKNKKKEDVGPMIIPKQSNRDWKEAAGARKRQKSGLPAGGNGRAGDMDQKMKDVEAADLAKKPGFGLNLFKKGQSTQQQENGQVDGDADMANTDARPPSQNGGEEHVPAQPKTDDQLAVDALLGNTTTDKSLTITSTTDPLTESDAFRHDFASAPEMSTLDDYARVPVEQFGAALLRGMGWKDGEGIGSQRGMKLAKDASAGKIPARRAALLGIGAKEDAAIAQEMGVWGKHARGGKEVKIYNPVLLKDKKTGEMFTEEELQRRKEKEERRKYEEEFERKERQKTRKDRHGDNVDDDRRDRRRERSDDAERRDRRKYDDDDDMSDEEYYRRKKEKERRRRKEREERDGGGGERSRRHRDYYNDDDDRDRHRRDRDRDRRR